MVIDTSAVVAILGDEAERRRFNEAIEAAGTRRISVATFVEATIVLEVRRALVQLAGVGGRDERCVDGRVDTLRDELHGCVIGPVVSSDAGKPAPRFCRGVRHRCREFFEADHVRQLTTIFGRLRAPRQRSGASRGAVA